MDDFGRGFSSLSHLRGLPIAVIKIDGSFVSAVAVAGPDRAIIAAILSLGEEMGLTVIAEHIEDEDPVAGPAADGLPARAGPSLRAEHPGGRPAPRRFRRARSPGCR